MHNNPGGEKNACIYLGKDPRFKEAPLGFTGEASQDVFDEEDIELDSVDTREVKEGAADDVHEDVFGHDDDKLAAKDHFLLTTSCLLL